MWYALTSPMTYIASLPCQQSWRKWNSYWEKIRHQQLHKRFSMKVYQRILLQGSCYWDVVLQVFFLTNGMRKGQYTFITISKYIIMHDSENGKVLTGVSILLSYLPRHTLPSAWHVNHCLQVKVNGIGDGEHVALARVSSHCI